MLNHEFPPLGGGGGRVTKTLAEELVKLGHEVDVVTMGFKGLKRREEIKGVNIYRIPCIRKDLNESKPHEMFSYCISASIFMKKLLREKDYDINHAHFILPASMVSYFNTKKIPYIITAHGSDVPMYNPDRLILQHKLLNPLWRKVIKSAGYVVTPTYYLKDLILKSGSYDRIQVIPNCIDHENFIPKNKEMKVLVVSRLLMRKGIQYVIEATKDIEGYELIVCGDGPYKGQLQKQISELNDRNIHLLGYVTEERLKYEYETSSIFVLPSSAENFPIVLLEAMSAGCAIITANTTGCPEVVGDTALLVRPKNSDDIKDALIKLMNNDKLRSELGVKARRRVEEKFAVETIAKKYLSMYEEVID
jgi:glycosyltransferase involved in cell wall biosynthesis